ncbi:MFS general substrate transporter [Periconia macrospinosa]|uniref:MFS general substrate transporter n=1 Tax=Periconia macrospinosa TaxID=97972 RepID=A0A2V1E6T8_9PLEO|nr:MFS general substrate transporter [Periconia macrospinosa]
MASSGKHTSPINGLNYHESTALEPRLDPRETHSITAIPPSPDAASIEKFREEAGKEGGFRGWMTVLGSSLVYFASFGIISSFGFFQDYYREHFLSSVPASTISFVGTLQITLMNILAAPAGSLYDWYGVKALYIVSGVGSAGALVGLSFLQSGKLWQVFLVQGVILGITISVGAQPALVAVNQHFIRRRALVMGIVAAAGSVGGVCFPLILARLNDLSGVGYAWSLRVIALMVALCYAIALLVSFWDIPSHAEKSLRKFLDFRGFLDRRYSVLCAGAFIAMLGQFVPYYYISSYTADVHPTSSAKYYLLPLMNACSFLGRILGGLAADKTGPANSVYPMTILSGLLCLVTWAVTTSVPVLICFVILYGLSSGVFIAVLPVIIAQITPASSMGGRIGAFYSVCAIAQLVGSPIGGAMIKKAMASADGTDGVAVERADDGSAYLGLILFSVCLVALGVTG